VGPATEDPPGTRKVCRTTCQPSSVSLASTQSAASKYAGVVPGRGPTTPARCRTAAIAVRARTSFGSARSGTGADVSAGGVGSGGSTESVGVGGVDVAGGPGVGSAGSASSAVHPVSRTRVATVSAETDRMPRR
jgi:hypothetical protein